jgi:hypothetical protein
MSTIQLTSYALIAEGLSITYFYKGDSFTLSYDAKATANLFKELRIIDDFDLDTNGEPVILGEREHDYEEEATGQIVWTTRPVFIFWGDYVKTQPLFKRHFEIIAEAKEEAKASKKLQAQFDFISYTIEHPELKTAVV